MWHAPGCESYWPSWCRCMTLNSATHGLPDFPNDLAACVEGLEHFCKSHEGFSYCLAWNPSYGGMCSIYEHEAEIVCEGSNGETKQEAIIAAVLAAKGQHE